jgi:peptidoglycan/LPS O-acetylase OafA/YrhL
LSLPVLICNAVLLQTAACPQFGGNGPLWSLFNEAWYYLLFPCFALAALAAWPRPHRLALAALGAAVLAGLTGAQFTGSPLAPYMLIWAMGAVAAILKRPVLAEPWQAAAVLAAVLLLIRLAVRRSFAGDHPLLSAGLDVVVSLLFANLLLTMRFCRTLRPPPLARLHHTLAACSFSLYCTHSPVLVVYITALVATAGIGWQMPGDSSLQWLAIGGALILCVGFAYGFAQVTEAHTTVVRRWLTQVGSPRFRPLR